MWEKTRSFQHIASKDGNVIVHRQDALSTPCHGRSLGLPRIIVCYQIAIKASIFSLSSSLLLSCSDLWGRSLSEGRGVSCPDTQSAHLPLRKESRTIFRLVSDMGIGNTRVLSSTDLCSCSLSKVCEGALNSLLPAICLYIF